MSVRGESGAPGVTALMAVHAGADGAALTVALRSLVDQTLPADEVLVVADGALTPALEAVLRGPDAERLPLHVIRLPASVGAGPARQAGLGQAVFDYVAIADSDDRSESTRFARQVAVLDGGADVVGSAVTEVDASTGVRWGVRAMPLKHEEIARLARFNNPVNHPTLMARRDVMLRAGGYRDLPMLEDYDLCARLVAVGAVFANLPDALVEFRGGAAAQQRRRSWAALRAEWRMQRILRRAGLVSRPVMARNWVVRTGYRLLPRAAALALYRRVFVSGTGEAPVAPTARPEYDRHVDMSEVRGPLAEKFALQALRTAGFSETEATRLDVLDVGAGYGDTARELARRCRHVTCLEPARDLHDRSRGRAAAEGIANMAFVLGGVEDLTERDAFDLVVMDNVYEHLPDQRAALRAVWAALRPGGMLFLLTPNKLWPVEAHYGLVGLSWLPLPLANRYLRASGRGQDYRDASYAPTARSLRRDLDEGGWDYSFVLPAVPEATVSGSPWYYRAGMRAIDRVPALWTISKALLVVAEKRAPSVQP